MVKRRRLEIFLDFLIYGLIMGVLEDLIAVKVASGAPITWRVVFVVMLVAFPFAIIGELFVDRSNILPDKDAKKWNKLRKSKTTKTSKTSKKSSEARKK